MAMYKVMRIDRATGEEKLMHANFSNKADAQEVVLQYVANSKNDKYRYVARKQGIGPIFGPNDSIGGGRGSIKIETTDGRSLNDAFTSLIKGAIAAAPKRRGHMDKAAGPVVGDRFDYFGNMYEVTHVGRDKKRTLTLTEVIKDRLGDLVLSYAKKSMTTDAFLRDHFRPVAKRVHMRKRSHMDKPVAVPTFKVSSKPTATMTASAINAELDKLDAQDSKLGDAMIAAGRGYERPSEYLKMSDPLSLELRKNSDRRFELRFEIERRYGPGAPRRLPSGRGFGPRKN